MRVLVIGDPHARASALSEFDRLTAALAALAARTRPDLVVVTGDLLHEHAYVHTAALNAALELVRRLAAIPSRGVYVLMGNHDLASNQVFLEPRHAFNACKGWSGVHIVDRVVLAEGFAFVPYVPPGRFREALATVGEDWRAARAIFAHQEFRGARDGRHVSQAGDRWGKGLPLVVSGHYHTYQWLRQNLCYVGAPAAHDFGADEDEHGVSLLTFGADGGWEETRLAVGLPRRRTVVLPVEDADGFALETHGDLVRLIVTGAPEALLAFRKGKAYRRLAAVATRVVLRSTAAPVQRGAHAAEMTYLDRLRAYAAAESDSLVPALLDAVLRGEEPLPAVSAAAGLDRASAAAKVASTAAAAEAGRASTAAELAPTTTAELGRASGAAKLADPPSAAEDLPCTSA